MSDLTRLLVAALITVLVVVAVRNGTVEDWVDRSPGPVPARIDLPPAPQDLEHQLREACERLARESDYECVETELA